jgi:hypothetical protein
MAARSITGNFDYINMRTDAIMNTVPLSSFIGRRKYHLAGIMFKAIHGPSYLSNNVLFAYYTQKIHRSFDNMFYINPNLKNIFLQTLLCVMVCDTWNKVPLFIKEATSLNNFKMLTKEHFIQPYLP